MEGQCHFCKSEIKDKKEYACKKCRSEIRKHIEGFEDLLKVECPGHCGIYKFKKMTYWGLCSTREQIGNKIFDNGCSLCASEVLKEYDSRKRKAKKRELIEKSKQLSLKERCAKVIALDPGLLLVATTHDPPIDEITWKLIYQNVPNQMSNTYKEALVESVQNNQSEWMYKTIGTVFARYTDVVAFKKIKL